MTDTPSHAVLSVGDTIAGKYRIDGTLGTGGMGIVFAANHLALDRTVAVKVMRAEMAEHAEAVERLLLEAKLAARFRGEHVCRVLDVGTLPSGVPFIVMEYLEGADLATLLGQQGSFDVPTAADFVMEASEALASMIMQSVCDDYGSLEACKTACNAVPDLGGYDTSHSAGDSVQCRLWHVSAAADEPNPHCLHAAGKSYCVP